MVVRAAYPKGHGLNLPHGDLLSTALDARSLHPKTGIRWWASDQYRKRSWCCVVLWPDSFFDCHLKLVFRRCRLVFVNRRWGGRSCESEVQKRNPSSAGVDPSAVTLLCVFELVVPLVLVV